MQNFTKAGACLMRNYWRIIPLLIVCVMAGVGSLTAQLNHVPSRERVDPTMRRRTEIDGNNVRTSVFNFVFSGRTGAGQGVPYEWPKNTNRYYVALVALFVGAEVTDDTGGVQRIVDLPAYRNSPGGVKDWNLNPIPGYFNPLTGKIAKSDDPTTWPSSWPDKLTDPVDPGWSGKWNGFFGKNQFNADQEVFARIGDDNYDRFPYSPDTTDLTRKGLGLIIDYRVLEWSQPSVADAVFFIHEVKNDGTKDLKKAAVTLWLADFVGGDGDSQDDRPDFDLIQDVAFSFDADGRSNNTAFANACVGAAATLYLETPGNAEDRIDNDGDSADSLTGKKVTAAILGGAGSFGPEIRGNQIDDNHNGLIDEDSTYIPFGAQAGVVMADGIDHNGTGETGSPVATQLMINQAQTDVWHRWPPNPESDAFWPGNDQNFQQESIHLLQLASTDLGRRYKDNIDNDGNCDDALPTVTQAMVDAASSDPYHRYRVPGTNVILYDVGPEDIGHKYLNHDRQRDAHVDEGINVMTDESRNDGIDNNNDWNPITDDVGLDGAAGTGDPGEGDGKPTSGVGTAYPGEPHIDKTDIREADMIGLTNVQYLAAGAINFSQTADVFFWASFMIPGSFVDPSLIGTGDYDLFVSSGLFPLRAGQIERISYAVVFGNAVTCPYTGDPDRGGARSDALRKREYAELAYRENYQFAQAPYEPTVTAVAGDHKVTLYWDSQAEESFDRFLSGVPGAQPHDFEGYKIFRATDPAFEDARVYRDSYGSPAPWLRPLATFDRRDGLKDFFPVAFNGLQYNLGSDNGLVHTWTDTTVQNGQKYYYVVRSYDQGWAPLRIIPAESNLKVSMDNVTGRVTSIGKSVAIVTPNPPVAGYLPPNVSPISLVQGSTTGKVGYRIVDPNNVRKNHRYRITFEDTTYHGANSKPDTIRTKSFTLADITTLPRIDTLINQSRALADTSEQPIIDGIQLIFRNEKTFGVNEALSGFNNSGIYRPIFQQWVYGFMIGQQKPNDYKIVFSDSVGADTSTTLNIDPAGIPPTILPSIPVNFKVINTSENKQIDFGFLELDNLGGPGMFSASYNENFPGSDWVIFLERDSQDSLKSTWFFQCKWDSMSRAPRRGDTCTIVLSKLFRAEDVFEFATDTQRVDLSNAKRDLDRIKVVPNPYVAASSWEERNPFSTGRGPRTLHFNHLPQVCTIRIYTVSGELVATVEHNSSVTDGTATWDLLTRDRLSVSYGIYIYHVDAPGVGEKIGKFAVIK
jgi:hypothetical protein